MVNMENSEEVMQILDRFTRLKQKEIPKELDEYLQYVAKTGDTVFKWSSLKYLFREKLLNVIKHFHDTTPRVDEIPQYPNVDPFNYESMKTSLLERLEVFNAAPFTIQRLCELLIDPRKQYSRIDKFMRALEKNILVVSTIEPGRKRTESENGDSLDSVVNGDLSLDVNVDIDMENESLFNTEAQNGNGTANNAQAASAVESEADRVANAAAAANEVKEKPITEKHTADDDILPNPKKAKLDIDVATEESEPKEVAEKVDMKADSMNKTSVETKIDVKTNETEKNTNADITDTTDVDMQETAENKDTLKKHETELSSPEDKVTEPVSGKSEAAEKEEAKDETSSQEKKAEEKAESDEVVKSRTEEKGLKAAELSDETLKVETEKETIQKEKNEITAEETNKKEDKLESVIEKQEIEGGEKEHVTEPKTLNEDTLDKGVKSDASQGSKDVDKTDKEETSTDVVSSDKNIEEKEVIKAKDETCAIEETVLAAVTEQLDSSSAEKSSKADSEKDNTTESTYNIPKDNRNDIPDKKADSVVDLAPQSAEDLSSTKLQKHESDSNAEVSAERENEQVANEKTDKKLDSDKEESITTATAVIEEKAASDVTLPDISSPKQPTAIDASDNETTAAINIEKLPKPIPEDVTSEAETSAEPISKDVVETTELTTESITPVITPILALNDQPMEENTADVPLQVLDVISPTAVEEVVMDEAGSGGTTEMATDAIEPTKDEPSGMEVDDTSQEAMDQ